MDLAKGKEQVKKLLNKTGGVFRAVISSLKKTGAALAREAVPLLGRLPHFFPDKKKRSVFFAFGGLALLLLILVIGALAFRARDSRNGAAEETAVRPPIPMDELFIPGEPDFLPGFIPEREPRSSWSVEDIRPYWKNPENPELWRGEIKAAVDKLMEAVP